MTSGRGSLSWLDNLYKAPASTPRSNLLTKATRNYDSAHHETVRASIKKEADSDDNSSQSVFNPFEGEDQSRTCDKLGPDRARYLYSRPQPRSAPARVDPPPPEPRARSAHQQAYERLDAKKRKINEEKRQIMEEQRRIRIWAGKRRDQLKTARELVRRAEAEKQIALANARSYTGIRAIRPGR
ncbi:hypothetical protein HBI56_161450 [Parastagonospora nodorum]|nr:hypothetical protein HBI10_186200 [Parastagonospora nodorum]KAH4014333.1 hypothetical protein HBI13_172810 [Parastagonospora nodorum]KAH4022496.1 hypothetical protein HBI09_170220 [Parastagonospora nodorum]KAH4081302.1 hypothetical protein HBH46_226940 [Parastagonospora nodorum]KAH4113588.1 hypothetical protein HBH47_208600 [Parastagonospora nodorum]